jgi:Ca2+-binding EF-hand superfamily protein
MKKTLLIATAGAVLMAGGIAAADDGSRVERLIKKADVNADGVVSVAELVDLRRVRFVQSDTNGDKVVTLQEITAAAKDRRSARLAKRLKRMDTNGNGAIEESEFVARVEKRFAKVDKNGDGVLTREEITEAHEKRRAKRLERRGTDGKGASE